MKKRICHRILLLFFFCILISFAACQKGSNEPDGNGSFNQKSDSEPNGNDGLSQKIDGQGLTKEQKEDALEFKGTAFGKLPIVGEEDPVYCNLPENIIDPFSFLPLCHDPLYDILYYVDYGGDSMIHAVRDGKSEVAVRFPGKRLFCRQGKLYFLLDANTDFAITEAKNGNILSYDPVSGEITVISNRVFDTITVYQDCILCEKAEPENPRLNTLFYFFDTGEFIAAEKYIPSMYLSLNARYGDYFFASPYGTTSWRLCCWDGSGSISLDGIGDIGDYFYVKGDDIIWIDSESIHFGNIPSKQEKIIKINAKRGGAYSFFYNHYYYTGRGSYIDTENGISQKCYCMSSSGYGSDISEFYTDGDRIYGFAGIIEGSNDSTKRLCCIEWRSMEDALALIAEDETALDRLNFAQEQALQEDGEPLEGILLLTPIDQLFQ